MRLIRTGWILFVGWIVLACTFSSTVLTPPPQNPAQAAQNQAITPATPTRTATRPFQPQPTRRPTDTPTAQPTINLPSPSATKPVLPAANGAILFEDDFQIKRMKPLFDEKVMTLTFMDKTVRVTGVKPGVLPVMYQEVAPADLIAEVDVKADAVAVGTHFGFILRSSAAMIELPQYYLALFNFNGRKIGLSCWKEGKWVTSKITSFPEEVKIKPGDFNRLRLEAVGGQFRLFINQTYAATFGDDLLSDKGYFGFYISTDSSRPSGVEEAAIFRDLKIFNPVK